MERALSLFEIRTTIATQLTSNARDIHTCRLLNRDWNLTLDPIFWHRVHIKPKNKYTSTNILPTTTTTTATTSPTSFSLIKSLTKKAHHVRFLTLEGYFLPSLLPFIRRSLATEISPILFTRLEALSIETQDLPPKLSLTERHLLTQFLHQSCANVNRLDVRNGEWTERIRTEMTDVFWAVQDAQLKKVKSLYVTANGVPKETMETFWKAVCECGVRVLDLDGFYCKEPALLGVWRDQRERHELKERRQEMERYGVELVQEQEARHEKEQELEHQQATESTGRNVFSQVRELTLTDGPASANGRTELIALLILSPELESIHWDQVHSFPQIEFFRAMELNVWENLHSLRGDFRELEDDQVASVLRGMNKIQRLTLYRSKFGPVAFKALCDHTHGLSKVQCLDLYLNKAVTSRMIQTVLEEAPLLQEFRATTPLAALDALEGRPWACRHSLKELNLCFALPSQRTSGGGYSSKSGAHSEDELLLMNRAMILHLSTLGRLETFRNTSGGICLMNGQRHVTFDLKGGLHQLQAWTRMRSVLFYEESIPMASEDLDWMLEHWSELRDLQLRLPVGVQFLPDQVKKARAKSMYLHRHRD